MSRTSTPIPNLTSAPPIAETLELLDRAIYDLEHGWPEAATDAIGRARRLIETHSRGGNHG